MRVLILGCNQLTTNLVLDLAQGGSHVTVVANDRPCLEHLADAPRVQVILSTEPQMEDYLQQGGIDNAEVFLALSDDDHQNALAAQIALHIFNVPKVVCHLDNPQLQILYSALGLDVVGYSFGLLQDIRQAIES
ncbi:MAG: NAD-binding protein [Dehalococcoidia bacterium]|jgi:trk system potassium uptake protein TrkA|nr:NAD-binding protein [Dehalococcoidia bacterium]MDP6228936.1 NAD-binding protein [Dehalococcoidia bacterium]MDP7083200.1 NAD-binding protein [Dehalococcoidia bacterium]MDP7199920.1 NAD-binding protein [Dehalococcoidia bacterium]MDP7510437.1 NAD-binding protein [Dehalococcoidia bacterium]